MEDYPLYLFTPVYKQFTTTSNGNIDLSPPQDEYYFIKEFNASGSQKLLAIAYMGLKSDTSLKGIKSRRADSHHTLKIDFPIMLKIDPQKKFRFGLFLSGGDVYGDYMYFAIKKTDFDNLNANLQRLFLSGQLFKAYDVLAPLKRFP